MDYCLELSYDLFIANEMLEQARLERYVNESLLLAEGTNISANMTVIVEAFGDKFKEVIKKIVNAIVNMWHKFLEGMNTLVRSDKGYLEKYKATILKKQVKLGSLSMPNYEKGINDILNKKIPAFNYQSLKTNLAGDKESATFRKSFYSDYNPEVEFSAFVKNKMQGGDKDVSISASQLNMTNLYNFCYNFDKLAKNIENEIKTINTVGNQAMSIIDEKVRNMPKTESGLIDTVQHFSYLYESLLTETELSTVARKGLKDIEFGLPKLRKFPLTDPRHVSSAITYFRKASPSDQPELAKNIIKRAKQLNMKDINIGPTNPIRKYIKGNGTFVLTETVKGLDGKDPQAAASDSGTASKSTNDNDKYTQSQKDGDHDAKDTTKQNLQGESPEEATENIKTYINICGQFLAAKMTVARNCHKDYMAIMRAHVRSYAGDVEADKNPQTSKSKDIDTNAAPAPTKKEKIVDKLKSWK